MATKETIEEIGPEEKLKQKKISAIIELERNTRKIILRDCPVHEQINAALGIYSTTRKANIKKWIATARNVYLERKKAILDAKSEEDIKLNFSSLTSIEQSIKKFLGGKNGDREVL